MSPLASQTCQAEGVGAFFDCAEGNIVAVALWLWNLYASVGTMHLIFSVTMRRVPFESERRTTQ
jgi:hypothetical protein